MFIESFEWRNENQGELRNKVKETEALAQRELTLTFAQSTVETGKLAEFQMLKVSEVEEMLPQLP